jgi:hypothetical protein
MYSPGFRNEKRKTPESLVVNVLVSPVAVLLMITVALATTAPEGSVTVPVTPPVTMFWAQIRAGPVVRARTKAPATIIDDFLRFRRLLHTNRAIGKALRNTAIHFFISVISHI